MTVHTIQNIQNIPISLEQAWSFYSSPANLQMITPPQMKLRIISKNREGRLYPGLVIEYKVSPLMGIPLYWMTEIRQVSEPASFVDEQRKGPYRYWQHRHYFKTIEGGVEMKDIIEYKNPLGLLGEMANSLFIKRKLRQLFEYRFHKIEELFGKWPGGQEMNLKIK